MLLQLVGIRPSTPRAVPLTAPPPAQRVGVGGRSARHAVEPGVALAGQVGEEVGPQAARNVDAQGVRERGQGRARTLDKKQRKIVNNLDIIFGWQTSAPALYNEKNHFHIRKPFQIHIQQKH
jgi:hypothetical protein